MGILRRESVERYSWLKPPGGRRMKIKLTILIAVALMLPACSSISAEQATLQTPPPANVPSAGSELVEGYKGWTRVNPEPELLHAPSASLCGIAMSPDPHLDKYITVYVNENGKNAMMKEKHPRFPQGSVIVKEKLPSKESTSPELLTVMVKREDGYNPESGDWEYMITNGTGKEVHDRGRLEKCQSCHMMAKDNDFVSRTYLPRELRKKLK